MLIPSNLRRVSAGLPEEYWRLFVNRRAYTLQSDVPNPESGRRYFYRPRDKGTGEGVSLALDTIRYHLGGRLTIGLYAANPETQRCKWLAIDADYNNALGDLGKLAECFEHDWVASALEESRRGAHLWVFMAEPLLARDIRVYARDVAARAGVPLKLAGNQDGIEIFPRQDFLRPGEFGNAIRGPLGIHRGAGCRFWFRGVAAELAAQMKYLTSLRKLTAEHLASLIAGKVLPELAPGEITPGPGTRKSRRRVRFRILDHIQTPLRRAGRNNVTRCPSCAAQGHDQGNDNLSIAIEDPRKYKCWAGCTKDQIREALGCPRATIENILREESR
jgi:hypothetical protein